MLNNNLSILCTVHGSLKKWSSIKIYSNIEYDDNVFYGF